MKQLTAKYIEVFRSDLKRPITIIEEYHDENHPNRKWCYRLGLSRVYSETAKTIDDMVREYLSQEVEWSYCGEHGITLSFVTHMEE